MPKPQATVLGNTPDFLRTEIDKAGAAIEFALLRGEPNDLMCQGILGHIRKNLVGLTDVGAFHRIEAGLNIATQFMQGIEEAATAIKCRFPNSTEERNMLAMRQLSEAVEASVMNDIRRLPEAFEGNQQAIGTIEKICDAYVPFIIHSKLAVSEHFAGEYARVRAVEDVRRAEASKQKGPLPQQVL